MNAYREANDRCVREIAGGMIDYDIFQYMKFLARTMWRYRRISSK